MRITRFALEHRTTVVVLIVMIVVMGMSAYRSLPREAAPDLEIPVALVSTIYPGVSPEDMERLVTEILEGKFEDLDDLDEMTSSSSEGVSLIRLDFSPSSDTSDATQEIRDRVEQARQDLPDEIEGPTIAQISSSDWPVIIVHLHGPQDLARIRQIADELASDIESISGVLEAKVVGGREREIRVEVDPAALKSYGLSLNDVIQTLASEDVNVPGGSIKEGQLQYTLRIPHRIDTPLEILEFVVKTTADHAIRLREVATVLDDYKERQTESRYRGEAGVSITVTNETGGNILDTVDAVKALVSKASLTFPDGMTAVYLQDKSEDVRGQVRDLENSIFTALVLIVAVLFLFMGGRNALFVALAVPLSLLISFSVLSLMGLTLNMVVLMALVLALGMLVDNAIVVVENIYRHSRTAESLWQAAWDGTREVGWAVVSSTLTTLSVFFPLLAWPGIMGKFFVFLPITLIVTLSSSLFVAIVLNPVISSLLMKRERGKGKGGKEGLTLRMYRRILGWSLRHRGVVVGSVVLILLGTLFLFVASRPQIEFMPTSTPDSASVSIEAAEGTRLDATDALSKKVEAWLNQAPNIKHSLAEVGASSDHLSAGNPTHRAKLSLDFQDQEEWTENPWQTIENLRSAVADIPGAQFSVKAERRGPPTGSPVNIEIAGEDFVVLQRVADEVKMAIKDVDGLAELTDDFSENRPELRLAFDRQRSNQLLLDGLRAAASTVRTAINGTTATTYRVGDQEVDVTVRLRDGARNLREDVMQLTIAGKQGRQVPLNHVAALSAAGGLSSIRHVDRKRVITVSAEANGRPGAEILRDVKEILADYQPAGATLSYTGENDEQNEAQGFMGGAFLLGIFLMAMVLLTQFDNLGQVLIILSSVVLSLAGILWGLIVNRMPFSIMMTGMGVISLAGVVVNNAIVLIDFFNQQRNAGMSLTEAVIEAGVVRLRPVLLTAATTILGLVPMAQGFDFDFQTFSVHHAVGTSEFWGPMAVAVIYGLGFATILTLVVVPTLLHLVESAKLKVQEWSPRLRLLLRSASVGVLIMAVGLAGLAVPRTAQADEAAPQVLTLKEALETAQEYSPALKSATAGTAQAKSRLTQAWTRLLPTVSASSSYTRNNEAVYMDIRSVPSATGGEEATSGNGNAVIKELDSISASLKASLVVSARSIPQLANVKAAESLARLQEEFSVQQLLYAVAQLYVGSAIAEETTTLMEENLHTAEYHLNLAKKRRETGAGTHSEIVRGEMQVVQAQGDLEQARLSAERTKSSLALLLGWPEDRQFQVSDPALASESLPLRTGDDELEERVDLRTATIRMDIAKRNVTDSALSFAPTLAANWNWDWMSTNSMMGDYPQWSTTFSVNWSVFEGGSRWAAMDEARAAQRAASYDREQARLQASTEVLEARNGIAAAQSSLTTATKLVALGEKNLVLEERSYASGAGLQADIIDARLELRSAQIQALRGRLSLQLAWLTLVHVQGRMGQLTERDPQKVIWASTGEL